MLKIRNLVLIGFCGIRMAYAVDSGEFTSDLQKDIEAVSERVRSYREAHADAPSVVVIGKTGRGKSTLITHLAGKSLLAQRKNDGITLRTEDPLPDFHIGSGVRVGTRIPTAWHDPASGVVYWDCPGFDDPRGASTEIVNAFSVQQLFQVPSRLKIVLVASEADFHARAESFGGLLSQLVNTLPDDQLFNCLSLVITRHRDIGIGILDDIYKAADESNFFIQPRVKSLVRFLADNAATRVSFMSYPSLPVGIDSSAYEGNRRGILESIASTRYAVNPIFRITIPSASQIHILELASQRNEKIVDYIRGETAAAVEAWIAQFIRAHTKTARAMKVDFGRYVERLTAVRHDTPSNFVEDLEPIFHDLGHGGNVRHIMTHISILDFFKSVEGRVEHRTYFWRAALDGLIARLHTLSQAPEVVEERRGRHIRTYEEHRGNRSEGEARGNRWNRERRDVHMGVDCYVYAIDEKIITHFSDLPAIGVDVKIDIIDDWTETTRTQTEYSGLRIVGYGPWH
jgi:hypothetical protein